MGHTGQTVGTIGGAAVGTAIAPGIGTVLGGMAGGLIGGMFDSNPGPPPPDPNNFALGNGNNSAATNQIAANDVNKGLAGNAAAQTKGNTAQAQANTAGHAAIQSGQQQSDTLQQQAAQNYQNGDNAQGRTAPQIAASQADQQRQLAALGGMQQSANQLQQMGTNGITPGVAAAQLKQGQDAAMAQSLAMAHSGRSLGSGASAMNQAQFQNAATNQATNQQAAVANLQEQQQNQQFQLGALGQAQTGYGNVANQTNTIRGANDQISTSNAGLLQNQQQVNNQTQAGYNTAAGQQANNALGYSTAGTQAGLGYSQLGASQNLAYDQMGLQQQENYDQMGQRTQEDQLAANEAYANLSAGNSIAGMQAQNQQQATNMGMISGLASAAASYEGSDRDAKKNIQPANDMLREQRAGAGMARGQRDLADHVRLQRELAALQDGSDHQFDPRTMPVPANDNRVPANDNNRMYAALGGPRQPDYAALDPAQTGLGGSIQGAAYQPPTARFPDVDLRPAQGYSYDYKDPQRFGSGTKYGPMAQDLEKTPAGASTVKTAADGTKMVDTSRLALVNTSAISEQQRKMDELQRQVAALGGAPTPYPNTPSPDTDRIDLYRGMQAGGTY